MRESVRITTILFLAIIICGALVYIAETYALDEIIDNFENENNIKAKYHTVRNTTYDRMELEYDVDGNPIYEDFTDWTEQDILTRIQPTANRSDFNMMRTDHDTYMYYDYGAGHFTDFTFEFAIYIDSVDSTASGQYRNVLIGCTNLLGDWLAYWQNTESLDLIATSNNIAGEFALRLVSGYNGGFNTWFWNQSSALDDDTYYFLTLDKSGKNASLKVYSNNNRTILVTRIECDMITDQSYRYLECPASLHYGSGSYWIDGYVEELWLGEVVGGYESEGTFHTKKLNTTAKHIVLLYNASIPASDVMKVQFSPDNTTWYNHNKQSGNDTLINGYESLDLQDLDYSSVFIKFYFLNSGADSTPELYQIRLINGETPTGNITTTDTYIIETINPMKPFIYPLIVVALAILIYVIYVFFYGGK